MAEKMVEKKNIFTATGVKKLEDELNNLIVVRRKEVAEKLKEARAQGDLSENAEYDAAKDEQRDIEARIEEIQTMLKNAEIVDEDEIDLEKVNVGCNVKTKDMTFKEEVTFQIVGSNETDSLHNKISNESPIGMALMGKKVGQTAEVELPNGTKCKYKILEIQRVEN